MSDRPAKRPIDYIWPLVGLVLGTAVVGSLILSTDPRARFFGGLVCGGIPFGLIGLAYAIFRARRKP